MRLRALHLTNFRQHADTTIEFGLGVTGIIGPNGTGKTTILEGIAWALYGNEAARGKRDSIRFARADAKAPVRVELEFELTGHRYRVVRGLTSAELYLDGGSSPVANSLTSVTEMLQRRIGMSREEFFNTYFTGQRELGVMSAASPGERSQFLSRVLGYERLRSAQELARERKRELNAELVGVQKAIPDRDAVAREFDRATALVADVAKRSAAACALRESAAARLAEVHPRWEAVQRDRALYEQRVAELRLANVDLEAREREHERAAADVAAADAAAAELAALASQLDPLPALRVERVALDAQAQDDGRRRALAEGMRAVEGELLQLRERRERLADAPSRQHEATAALHARRGELTAAEASLKAVHTRWTDDLKEAETRRNALRDQYAEIKAQLERIVDAGEDGECPTCARPLGTHFRPVHDALEGQLTNVLADGNYFKGRVEQLKSKPADLARLEQLQKSLTGDVSVLERQIATEQAAAKELAELDSSIARQEVRLAATRADLATIVANYDAGRHAVVRHELERLAPVEQRATGLRARLDQSDALRATLARAVADRDAAVARANALRTLMAGHAVDEPAFAALRAQFEQAEFDMRSADTALVNADADARVANAALERARADRARIADADARIDELTRERRLHEELDLAFADMRTELNTRLRPEVSRIASDFLSALTDGRYNELDLDDQYRIVIVEDGTPKTVISGGEEDLANLVLRLAISQLIAERAGQEFSLLVFDEIFGSLDEVRRQNVVDLLRALRDRFEQVVLITHIEPLQNSFDNTLELSVDPGTGATVVTLGASHAMSGDLLAEVSA